jgi:hypothetical protein
MHAERRTAAVCPPPLQHENACPSYHVSFTISAMQSAGRLAARSLSSLHAVRPLSVLPRAPPARAAACRQARRMTVAASAAETAK